MDAEHHEEEEELQVVVWTAQNSSLKLSICEHWCNRCGVLNNTASFLNSHSQNITFLHCRTELVQKLLYILPVES